VNFRRGRTLCKHKTKTRGGKKLDSFVRITNFSQSCCLTAEGEKKALEKRSNPWGGTTDGWKKESDSRRSRIPGKYHKLLGSNRQNHGKGSVIPRRGAIHEMKGRGYIGKGGKISKEREGGRETSQAGSGDKSWRKVPIRATEESRDVNPKNSEKGGSSSYRAKTDEEARNTRCRGRGGGEGRVRRDNMFSR